MRAVNLLVPASATFEGRLTPSSRVDVLAAFDLGQDRSVRRVLASGIVLHVTSQPAVPGAALTPMSSPAAERFGAAPVAELALAVPAASEREIVMAQAFGRVFVVVEPAAPRVSRAGVGQRARDRVTAPRPDDALFLRRYLGLPAEGSRAAAPPAGGTIPLISSLAGVLPPPVPPWPSAPGSRAGTVGGAAADPSGVTVEIIEGTARTFAEVRR